jgi:putative protease
MKKIELLAPAGSFEALEAAVMCGADAIYLGGTKFGARAFASNFDNEGMIKAVNYAHLYGVRIYVTVNTIIYDEEVASFLEYIDFLNSIGVDAFIIQDLGMLHLLSTIYPQLELHASTQMHIHNINALNKLKQLGVKRAVLPRELSISKIEQLKKESGMEIEIFVHGALCVSYSGQCLMSYLIGGRSGNRGECAGSCRLPYDLIEVDGNLETTIDINGKYPLSTKDLCTLDNIPKLIEAGIDSMKIEGRMKRPDYVALVTTLYRRAIDAYYEGLEYTVSEQDIKDLQLMFNRGFTKGYLFGDKGKNLMNPKRPNHMGVPIGKVISFNKNYITIKLNDNIAIGDGIRILSNADVGFTVNKIFKDNESVMEACNGDVVSLENLGMVNKGDVVVKTTDIKLLNILNEKYQNNNRKIELSAVITGHVGLEMKLNITDGINEVTTKSAMKISPSINNPVTKDKILEKLNKIGDTPYIFTNIDMNIDDNIFIPLTAINAIKREALDLISGKRIKRLINTEMGKYNFEIPKVEQNRILLKAKVRTIEQYQACVDNNIDNIYIEDNALYQKVKDDKRVILGISRVNKFKSLNEGELLVGEFGSVALNTITDYSLNIVNSYGVAFMYSLGAKAVTLSYEMDVDKIGKLIMNYKDRYLSNPNLEVIVYGRIEAMISEYCPLSTYLDKEGNLCNLCKTNKKYYLRDRFKNNFVLSFDNCVTSIYDYKKYNIIEYINKLRKIGVANFRLNFVDEDYDECSKLIQDVNCYNK